MKRLFSIWIFVLIKSINGQENTTVTITPTNGTLPNDMSKMTINQLNTLSASTEPTTKVMTSTLMTTDGGNGNGKTSITSLPIEPETPKDETLKDETLKAENFTTDDVSVDGIPLFKEPPEFKIHDPDVGPLETYFHPPNDTMNSWTTLEPDQQFFMVRKPEFQPEKGSLEEKYKQLLLPDDKNGDDVTFPPGFDQNGEVKNQDLTTTKPAPGLSPSKINKNPPSDLPNQKPMENHSNQRPQQWSQQWSQLMSQQWPQEQLSQQQIPPKQFQQQQYPMYSNGQVMNKNGQIKNGQYPYPYFYPYFNPYYTGLKKNASNIPIVASPSPAKADTPSPLWNMLPKSFSSNGAQIQEIAFDDSEIAAAGGDSDKDSLEVLPPLEFGPSKSVSNSTDKSLFKKHSNKALKKMAFKENGQWSMINGNKFDPNFYINEHNLKRLENVSVLDPHSKSSKMSEHYPYSPKMKAKLNKKDKYIHTYVDDGRSWQRTLKPKFIVRATLRNGPTMAQGSDRVWWKQTRPLYCNEPIYIIDECDNMKLSRQWSFNQNDQKCYLYDDECHHVKRNSFTTLPLCLKTCWRPMV